MKIHTIVIHYTATYPDQDINAATVDAWHRQRGWRGIGYHWLIRRDGTLEEGRPESEMGAHVRGHNSGTIGIAFVGGLDRATGPDVGVWNPTAAQERTMAQLIRDIQARHPGARKVVGHRDLVATQCPGGDAGAWWARQQQDQPAPALSGWAALIAALARLFRRD